MINDYVLDNSLTPSALAPLMPVVANVGAEMAALGAVLLKADVAGEVFEIAPPQAFYKSAHADLASVLIEMIEAGDAVDDPQIVLTELMRRGLADKLGGAGYLITLRERAIIPVLGVRHARDVREMWVRRTAVEAAYSTVQKACDPVADVTEIIARLAEAADRVMELREAERATPPPTFEDLMAGEENHNWIVPGLLETMDRLVLTGQEGGGKSVLNRQLAACLNQGRHPFTGAPLPRRLRVMLVDCENTAAQARRGFHPIVNVLRSKISEPLRWDGFYVLNRPEGLDLLGAADSGWLDRSVREARPDVLFVGPLYRLHNESINDEQAAKKLVATLDSIRVRHGVALVVEAHAGHAEEFGGKRKMRPVGSSVFLRWPEFGLGMRRSEDNDKSGPPLIMDLIPWRGSREDRDWPKKIMRGGVNKLPWIPYGGPDDPFYDRVVRGA